MKDSGAYVAYQPQARVVRKTPARQRQEFGLLFPVEEFSWLRWQHTYMLAISANHVVFGLTNENCQQASDLHTAASHAMLRRYRTVDGFLSAHSKNFAVLRSELDQILIKKVPWPAGPRSMSAMFEVWLRDGTRKVFYLASLETTAQAIRKLTLVFGNRVLVELDTKQLQQKIKRRK